jgi:hypothetical protein
VNKERETVAGIVRLVANQPALERHPTAIWATASGKTPGPSRAVPAREIEHSAMTTVANLLARKQKLLDRLQEGPEPNERVEIERLLAQIDTAVSLLEQPVSAQADDEE